MTKRKRHGAEVWVELANRQADRCAPEDLGRMADAANAAAIALIHEGGRRWGIR